MTTANIVIDTEKVQELLIKKCWTFEELAQNAGIAKTTAYKFVTGKSAPRMATIGKMCKALGCEPMDIIKKDGE